MELPHCGVSARHYPECSEMFWYFMHSEEPSDILTLVIPYHLGPEHGPSVDGLSTSPQPALGNECKQQKRVASTGDPNIPLDRECLPGKSCGNRFCSLFRNLNIKTWPGKILH